MGIRFQCPNGHKLNVKADLAGKRASCPECGVKLVIPSASAEPVTAPAAIVLSPAPPPGGLWYLQTPGGEQFGPAIESQFRSWIIDGRVTADSHIWRDGWPAWKLARDAADALPVPLAAVPVAATESVVLPVVPEPIVAVPLAPEQITPDPIVPSLTPQSVLALGLADVASAEPGILEAVTKDVPPAALNYAADRRRGKKTQLMLAIVMLLAVFVLAGVLIWVIMVNATAPPPPVSQAAGPEFLISKTIALRTSLADA